MIPKDLVASPVRHRMNDDDCKLIEVWKWIWLTDCLFWIWYECYEKVVINEFMN